MRKEFLDRNIWKNIPEKRKINASTIRGKTKIIDDKMIEKCGFLKTLKFILAYVLRFSHNSKNKLEKHIGPMTMIEPEDTNKIIILMTQPDALLKEIHSSKP